MVNAALSESLKKLRLSGMVQTLDVRLEEAVANRLDHAEFLELALQDELAIRHERLIARRTKAASFREQKTLEDFDWGKLIGDVATATAILDRILQSAEIIQITGKSYRLQRQATREKGKAKQA